MIKNLRIILLLIFMVTAPIFRIKAIANDYYGPKYIIDGKCGEYKVRVIDSTASNSLHPDHRDEGITSPPTLDPGSSFNFEKIKLSPGFVPNDRQNPNFDFYFDLNVKDKYKDAFAIFLCNDFAGTVTMDSIRYNANSLSISLSSVDFGKVRVGKSKGIVVELTSTASKVFNINSIRFKKGLYFETAEQCPPAIENILPGRKISSNLIYKPQNEVDDERPCDLDTLIIQTDCLTYTVPVKGMGVKSRVYMGKFNADVATLGESICNSSGLLANTLKIQNTGTDTLKVDSISTPLTKPFEISIPSSPVFPFKVPPGESVLLKTMCYHPDKVGEDSLYLRLFSDADNGDQMSILRGICVPPGPYITGFDWDWVVVGRKLKTNLYIRNSGPKPVKITGCYLDNGISDYKINYSNISPLIDNGNEVLLYPRDYSGGNGFVKEIIVPVEFNPQSEYDRNIKIFLKFAPEANIPAKSIYNYLRAYGVMPQIKASGYDFPKKTLVNTVSSDTGYVEIKSVSKTTELIIKDIKWDPSSLNSSDFILDSGIKGVKLLLRGKTLRIPVTFHPSDSGLRKASLIVSSNSGPTSADNDFNDTIITFTGTGYYRGLKAERLNFGSILLCNDSIGSFKAINLSSSDTMKILGAKFLSGDSSSFTILHDFSLEPIIIPPGKETPIKVLYSPSGQSPALYEAKVALMMEADSVVNIFTGESRQDSINFKINDIHDISPGIFTISHPEMGINDADFIISADSKDWANLQIDSVKLQVIYKSRWLRYDDLVRRGELVASWLICNGAESRLNDSLSVLNITASGSTPIQHNGVLFMPIFNVLLSDTLTYRPQIGSIDLYSRSRCAKVTKTGGEITLLMCTDQLGNISISSKKYMLSNVTPSPSVSGQISFSYSIPFEESLNIEIFNTLGKSVRQIENGLKKSGFYSVNLSTYELTPGPYYIIMKCGQYSETRSFMIGME